MEEKGQTKPWHYILLILAIIFIVLAIYVWILGSGYISSSAWAEFLEPDAEVNIDIVHGPNLYLDLDTYSSNYSQVYYRIIKNGQILAEGNLTSEIDVVTYKISEMPLYDGYFKNFGTERVDVWINNISEQAFPESNYLFPFFYILAILSICGFVFCRYKWKRSLPDYKKNERPPRRHQAE